MAEEETRTTISTRRWSLLRRTVGRFVPDAIWANWRWDALAGLCTGVYQGCIWSFALQLARGKLHAFGLQMGVATAAPAIGYLFAILWARQMEGRSKLPFVSLTWLLSRGLFMLTPLLVRGAGSREMFILLIFASPVLFSISTPAYTAIMKDIYPDALRGRMMSYVRIGMSVMMLVTASMMGYWQEHYGLDYRWMFAIGGVFGVGTALAFSRLRLPEVPQNHALPPIGQFLRETFGILFYNKGYRWFTISVFITGFGNLVATTLYPIYQVDRFHITPTQIATLVMEINIASLISLFFWGWFVDRYGSLTTVLISVLINALTSICYAFGSHFTWLYLGAAATGFAQSGIELGYLNTTLMFAEPGRASQYQAVHSTFFGLRGTIAPLVAIPIINAMGHSFSGAFATCLIIQLVGSACQLLSMQSYRRVQILAKREQTVCITEV